MKRGKKQNDKSVKSIVFNMLNNNKNVSKEEMKNAVSDAYTDKDSKWINKNISASIYFLRKDGLKIEYKKGIYTKIAE